jgi:hypothetical protein
MESDDEWKQKAIQRDMIATTKKLGKEKNTTVVLFYKIKSLGEDKRRQLRQPAIAQQRESLSRLAGTKGGRLHLRMRRKR